jgi:hypothetical protein
VRASATIAPVSPSCAPATSAVFPHTPARPVQAAHPAVCSHWKQNIFWSISHLSFLVCRSAVLRIAGVKISGIAHVVCCNNNELQIGFASGKGRRKTAVSS